MFSHKKSHTKLPFGFTLTELIVVISILAILATISFISIGNYFSSARDSARSMDIASISKSMEIFMVRTNNYPPPDNGKVITFSGGELWTQGTIGDGVMRMLGNVNKKVVDPKFGNEYTYSLLASIPGTNSKRAYTIAGILESNSAYAPVRDGLFSDTAFASTIDSSIFTAYTEGTYNGIVAKTRSGSDCYTIALPSIVIGDIPASGSIEDIGSEAFVYPGMKNLPESYSTILAGGVFTGAFEFRDYSDPTDQEKLILSTDCAVPTSTSELTAFSNKIQLAYADTNIASEGTYSPVVDTADASSRIKLSASIVNNYLGGTIEITNETLLPSYSCASPTPNNTSIPHSNTYTTGLPTSFDQSWVYSNVASNCTFACDSGYAWNGSSCVADQCGGGNVADYNGVPNGPQSYTGTWSYNTSPGVCNYSCGTGYTYSGGSHMCEPDNCTAQSQIVSTHDYSVPSMNHTNNQTITSSGVIIPGGVMTYSQNFSCSLGTLSLSGPEAANTPTCDSGYHLEAANCIANVQSCTYANASYATNTQPANSTSGTKTWNGSTAYGSCGSFSCDAGYGLDSGACVLIPGAPTGLASATITPTTFTLSWNASAGANGYRIYRAGTQYGSDLGAVTSANITGQTPGASVNWTLSAINAGGISGQSSALSVTQATNCTAGNYSVTGYTPCTAASVGNYVAAAAATAQTQCAIGTYQDTTGQSTCKTPTAGYWASPTNGATANTSQTQCAAGTYCSGGVKNNATAGSYVASAGATSQTAASAGNYVAGTSATAQVQCATGSYQPSTGQTSCTAASIGNYVASVGLTAQTVCAAGTYQDTTGQSTCKTPTAGYWASPTNGATANTAQTQCVAGTYCSLGVKNNATAGNYVAAAGATAQTAASAGNYVAGASATAQVQCAAGSYQPSTGQTSCTAAGVGYYVAAAGATARVAAAAGNYVSVTNATAQTQCAVNTYQASTAQSSCTACPGGSTSPAGSTSAAACVVTCPSGYTYVPAAGKCYSPLRAPAGYQAAWDNCAVDGATIISQTSACATVCGITGNCAAIASDKLGWWKGTDRNSYGIRVINSTSCPSGAGTWAISSYPDFMVTGLAPAGDSADGTHYYWCEK